MAKKSAVRKADLSSPESKKASAAANAEIRAKYGVTTIDPCSPNAAAMRRAWMDAYIKNGGKAKGVAKSEVQKVCKKIDEQRPRAELDVIVLPCGKKIPLPPLNKLKPCDVNSLHVKVGSKADIKAGTVADLTALARLVGEPAPEEAPPRIQERLEEYDLVIEAISRYIVTEKYEIPEELLNEIIAVTVETTWKGHCPDSKHPLVFVIPEQSTDPDIYKESKSAKALQFDVQALRPGFLDSNFGWASFPKLEPLPVQILAQSCGVRFDAVPKWSLNALLLVYPKDDWKITLKLPALGEAEAKGRGNKQSGELEAEGRIGTSKGKYETSYGHQEPKEEKEPPDGFTLVVSRNGSDIDAFKVLKSIINLIQTVKKIVKAFEKLLRIAPKIGYILNVKIAFLEISLSYGRGYRVSQEIRGSRFTAVTPYTDFTISGKILEVSVEFGIGFEVTIPNIVSWFKSKNLLEAVAKLSGSVEIKAEVDHAWKNQDELERELQVNVVRNDTLRLVASAEVLSIKLEALVRIRTEVFNFKCKAVWAHAKPATAMMSFSIDKADVHGHFFVDIGTWRRSPYFDHPLWAATPIYDGPFPPTAEGFVVPEWLKDTGA